jgi:hypothetical protein
VSLTAPLTLSLRLALSMSAVLWAGCGADDAAIAPVNPPRPVTCPSMQDLAPNALSLLRAGELPGLKRLLGERISDDEISALIDAALTVIESLPLQDLQRLLRLGSDARVSALLPSVAALIRFMLDAPADLPRDGLYRAMGRLLRTCDGDTVLTAFERLIAAPELPQVLADLGATLALGPVQSVLAESGGFGRRGITALLCNIGATLMTPEFDFERNVRGPLGALPALPLDEPPLLDLLDGLGAVLAPSKAALPALADLMCCEAYGVSTCAAIPPGAEPLPGDPVFTWLLYDLFVADQFDVQGLLGDAGALLADPTLREAVAPLGAVVRQLADDADLRATLTRLVATILEPAVVAEVLPDLALLLESGALLELIGVVDAIGNGCDPEAM